MVERQSLVAQLHRLAGVDRARVAEELLSSLEEPDDEVTAGWATELARRSPEVAEDRVQPHQLADRPNRDPEGLEQRRASRTAS